MIISEPRLPHSPVKEIKILRKMTNNGVGNGQDKPNFAKSDSKETLRLPK